MPHHHSQQVHQLAQPPLPSLLSRPLLPLALGLHHRLPLLLLGSRFLIGLKATRGDYAIGIVQFLAEYCGVVVVVVGQGVASVGPADEAVLVGLDLGHVYIIDSALLL